MGAGHDQVVGSTEHVLVSHLMASNVKPFKSGLSGTWFHDPCGVAFWAAYTAIGGLDYPFGAYGAPDLLAWYPIPDFKARVAVHDAVTAYVWTFSVPSWNFYDLTMQVVATARGHQRISFTLTPGNVS
jgi:hypothetical protein